MEKLIKDKSFYKKMMAIGLPVGGQMLITAGVNIMDTIMVGQVSEIALAAANIGSQIHLIFTYISMGTGNGSSVMLARYWGARNMDSLKQTMAIALRFILILGAVYTAIVALFPHAVLSVLTTDETVISQGIGYLQWSLPCYLLLGMSTVIVNILRNIGKMRLPLYISLITFFVNIFFNWIFIFGNLGAPAMGVAGAGLGTLISRIVEWVLLCGYLFFIDKTVSFKIKTLFTAKTGNLLREFFKVTVPTIAGDTLLGIGSSLTTAVAGRISQPFLSAASITNVPQQLVVIFTAAFGTSALIMTGNTLGEGKKSEVRKQGYSFIAISFLSGILLGIIVLACSDLIVGSYKISEETYGIAMQLMYAQALMTVIMIPASVVGKGILRGGGDTRFLLFADVIFIWVVSIPAGYVGGVILGWSPFLVFILLRIDHLIKLVVFIFRFRTDKWIKKIRTADECAAD